MHTHTHADTHRLKPYKPNRTEQNVLYILLLYYILYIYILYYSAKAVEPAKTTSLNWSRMIICFYYDNFILSGAFSPEKVPKICLLNKCLCSWSPVWHWCKLDLYVFFYSWQDKKIHVIVLWKTVIDISISVIITLMTGCSCGKKNSKSYLDINRYTRN